MRIFIDESGTFTSQGDAPVSVVGALWVPDARWDSLERAYQRRVRPGLPLSTSGEVKGSSLDEMQVANVLNQLTLHEIVFTACVVDCSLITPQITAVHRAEQGRRISANPTNNPYPEMQAALRDLSDRVVALNDQIYIQFVAQCELMDVVLRNAMVYLACRRPQELGRFEWVIDSKGDIQSAGAMPVERLWRELISPFVQSMSLRNPVPKVDGGDYSYFDEAFGRSEVPEYLRPFSATGGTGNTASGGAVLRDMTFSAAASTGLELVDIVTNATRRCLRGRLGALGWQRIPRIMIGKNPCSLNLVALGNGGVVPAGTYRDRLMEFTLETGLPILPRRDVRRR